MRISFMRAVDYWIGIPVCFGLSMIKAIKQLVRPRRTRAPRNILFIELSEMGSAILAHSSLELAQREFPQARFYFLIFARNVESVEILGFFPAGRILVVDDRSFLSFCRSIAGHLIRIRKLDIDTVIDLELFSRATAIIQFLSGAGNCVGFHDYTSEGLYRGNVLTHKVMYNTHQHIALNFLSLVLALTDSRETPLLKVNPRPYLQPLPTLSTGASDTEHIRQLVKQCNPLATSNSPLLVFNPDPGLLPLRGWPMENFCQLAGRLVRHFPNALIVVVGLARSSPYARQLESVVGVDPLVDLTGKTSTLKELIVLFSISRLLITNDSGPAHLAALTDIHSIVLFGPETPALYGPLSDRCTPLFAGLACSPCYSAFNHRKSICTDNKCLQAISVDQVFKAASAVLSDQRA